MTDLTDLKLSFKTMFSVQEGPSGGHRQKNKSQGQEECVHLQKGQNKKQNTNDAIQIATKTTIRNAVFVELSLGELIFEARATINVY